MNKKINYQFILVLGLSMALFACNQKDKKKDEPATTDTTATTEAVKPATQDHAMDAEKVAGDLYKVISDTLGIRIVEATYKPGDSSAMHSHPDYVVYTTQGGTATFYGKDGTKMESTMKTGVVNIRAAEFHSVKNTGKTTLKVILVEVNRSKEINSQDAATDATKVAPDLYKLNKDTLGIRVLDINYKPGQSSAMHAHPDNVLYVIEGGTGEFTDKDGKKNVIELKKGMEMIRAGESHGVKNIGKTTLKAILVEVNRARN
jgi:quercetin dioxygenase-like cupin family protein